MTACPVCDNRSSEFLFSKNSYRIVKCRGCGLVKADLSDKDFDSKEHYAGFFKDSPQGYLDYERDKESKLLNAKTYLSFAEKFASPPGRMLEVGAAFGFFAEVANDHWDIETVEVSSAGCAYMREHGNWPVHEGTLEALELPAGSFDVVTSFDCFEHLERPDFFVSEARRLLKPGGILVLSTVDVDAFVPRHRGENWRHYIPPDHLHYFSERTLKMILEKNGFKYLKAAHHSIFSAAEELRHVWRSLPQQTQIQAVHLQDASTCSTERSDQISNGRLDHGCGRKVRMTREVANKTMAKQPV